MCVSKISLTESLTKYTLIVVVWSLFSPPNNPLSSTFKGSSVSDTAGSTTGTNTVASRVGRSANVYKCQGSSETMPL
jgi:hypothetical protein